MPRMPLPRAYLFQCPRCRAEITIAHPPSVSRKRTSIRDAETSAHHDHGWRQLYDDWYCPACADSEKRERRTAIKTASTSE